MPDHKWETHDPAPVMIATYEHDRDNVSIGLILGYASDLSTLFAKRPTMSVMERSILGGRRE
jgi:hypothetical protein